jgi:hypothetical protein
MTTTLQGFAPRGKFAAAKARRRLLASWWPAARSLTNRHNQPERNQMSTADEQHFLKLVAEALLALASHQQGRAKEIAEQVAALASQWDE